MTLDLFTTLELESLQSSNADIDQEAAACKSVDRLAILSAGTTTTRGRNEQLCANEARTCGLACGQPDLRNNLALGRDPQYSAAVVQCSPHVALLIDTVTVWHRVLAVLVIFGHPEERSPVCN